MRTHISSKAQKVKDVRIGKVSNRADYKKRKRYIEQKDILIETCMHITAYI